MNVPINRRTRGVAKYYDVQYQGTRALLTVHLVSVVHLLSEPLAFVYVWTDHLSLPSYSIRPFLSVGCVFVFFSFYIP